MGSGNMVYLDIGYWVLMKVNASMGLHESRLSVKLNAMKFPLLEVNMQALTFKATVKNGMIRIPRKYQNQLPEHVKIVVFPEKQRSGEDAIERLLANPLRITNFQPLSREDIHDRSL